MVDIAKLDTSKLDTGRLSDGYHTFDELYTHRNALFLALARRCEICWRSMLHADGTMFEGWFIAGCYLPDGGHITYHLPLDLWEHTTWMLTFERADVWDEHTSADVVQRLMAFVG